MFVTCTRDLQVLALDNQHVRMWDFRASLGMDKNDFHQHILDNAWVVIGDGSSLNVYIPEDGPKSASVPLAPDASTVQL